MSRGCNPDIGTRPFAYFLTSSTSLYYRCIDKLSKSSRELQQFPVKPIKMVDLLIRLYEKIDAILVRYGSFNSTQRFRLSVGEYYLKSDGHVNYRFPDGYINDIIRENIMLRQITQEEENVSEMYGALKSETTTEENKMQLSKWLQRLEDLSRQYWFHERDLYQLESRFPAGSYRRAYDAWRSNPKWYLHPDLSNDCAGRGGCCGRDCGCCETRHELPGRRRGAGHCTAECGCCAKARGFDLTDKEKERVFGSFWRAFSDPKDITFSRRYGLAFFFGVESDRIAAPKWI